VELVFIKPHQKQKEVIKSLDNPKYQNVVICAGRQSGKSAIVLNYCVKYCNDDAGRKVLWVSPKYSQCKEVYNEILDKFYHPLIVKSHKCGKGEMEIVFSNGSKILFRSAASGDSLRGPTVRGILVIDEMRDIPRDVVDSVLLPMLNTAGKALKVIITSTPAGKSNILYEWWLRGNSDEYPNYISHRWTCYDTPTISPTLLEERKRDTPDAIFRQEYLAEFVDSSSVFDNIDDALVLEPMNEPVPGTYYMGVDIGLIRDATVCCIIDESGNLVKYYRWVDDLDTNFLIAEINRLNEKWKFKKVMVESNNQGGPVIDLLRNTMSNVVEFNTNSNSKLTIINNLISQFKTGAIKCVNDNLLRDELESFIFIQKDGGYMQFRAGTGHDDIVMSLAIAIECFLQHKFNPRYLRIYGDDFN